MDEPGGLLVRDVMVREPVGVTPEAAVSDAVALMVQRKIGALVVCEEGRVVGIFTERDVVRQAATSVDWTGMPVARLMTPDPFTVTPSETWATAGDLMVRKRVRHLPVVEGGCLVGMLSVRDLMQHRARHLEWLVARRTAELEAANADLRERDRLIQYHLDVAGALQRQLLPGDLPELPPFRFAVLYHPLERVSGDYYDFTNAGPGRVGILLADAAGHSVPAAFVSVMAKTAFQAYARGTDSPGAVLGVMNDRLGHLMEAGHFITMFFGTLDREARRLTYALAGHPPPLWYRHAEGAVEALQADGVLIGLLPEPVFEERSVTLCPGDAVLVYTDGVIDCRDPADEMFGLPRLHAFLAGRGCDAGPGLAAELDAELARYRGGEPFRDDVTAIAVTVER